jgi:hypothetical protein
MTKRDYEMLAEVIRSQFAYKSTDAYTIGMLAGDLACELADRNPRFDRARFMVACGVNRG